MTWDRPPRPVSRGTRDMYFQQFYLGCLAHASYMLGSEGIAVVVDPQRDVEIYLEEAARQNLRIAYIIETHLHADFVSGHRELAARTGAQICLGRAAGATFPHRDMVDGDELRFGRCVLRFLETPGHTLESMCVLVTDVERSPQPYAVLTGDTLFIGDVGRPDLSPDHTPQQLAAMMYRSLHNKLLTLPDDIEVYPAHGAGSLCGRNISAQRQSTIGEQRRMNYALKPMSEAEFVRLLTSELAARPGYFSEDAEINRTGAPALTELPLLRTLTVEETVSLSAGGAIVISPAGSGAAERGEAECREDRRHEISPGGTIEGDAVLLDVRPADAFLAAHIPGSINIGLGGQFASWAATILGLHRTLILVAENEQQVSEARTRLARVGIENVIGYLQGGIAAWHDSGRPLSSIPEITAAELGAHRTEQLQILDVRRAGEWKSGHIAGAIHLSLDDLALDKEHGTRNSKLETSFPLAIHCKGGYRSAIACSLLERAGFRNLMNVTGGFDAWQSANLPIATDEPAPAMVTR